MKAINAILLLMFSTTLLISQDEVRDLESFDQVRASSGVIVQLLKGDPRAEITMKKGDINDLVTEVKNGKLIVKFKSMNSWFKNNGNRSANIDVYYDGEIESISSSGGAQVTCQEVLSSDQFEAHASGGGRLDLAEVNTEELDVHASGGGRLEMTAMTSKLDAHASGGGSIRIEGKADKLDVNASGGGSYRGNDLKSKKVNANASGGGSVSVWAEDYLEASASGGGSVKYKGDPETDINVGKYSGGSVRKF